jgi:dephospho-CoA kinase
MRALGLTGGVGMGKSAAADLFAHRGVPVIDTDLIARELVDVGQPALEEVRTTFGNAVIAPDGSLLREELAQRVFDDTAARRQLEAILHPRIHARWTQRLDQLRSAGAATTMVVIPLLFETDTQSMFDLTICLACSTATQRQRLRERGWTEAQVRQRNAAQLPIERKMELADRVVWNEGARDVLEAQIDFILHPGLGLRSRP